MRLGLRVFFGFFLIAGLSAVLLLKVFLAEVKPSVREVMEDLMVDTANLLAETAADEMEAGGIRPDGWLATQLKRYTQREVDVMIWGLRKQSLDLRIYVTDTTGRVVMDSGQPSAVGQDYSQWRDVALTLRGEYGARSSRDRSADDRSTVLVVAAPVVKDGRKLGVVSLTKPVASVQRFIDRAETRVFWAGAALLAASLVVGVAVTLWLVASVRRLRRYAQQAQAGQAIAPPDMPGELGDLAQAMDDMRRRMEGREQLEHDVRALTHELKSPLAALRASGELLQDELPAADRQRFAAQVLDQTARLQTLVERVLGLSQLEAQVGLSERQHVVLADWAEAQLDRQASRLAQKQLRIVWTARHDVVVDVDATLLELALGNLLVNAIDFAPSGSTLELAVITAPTTVRLSLRDQGPGVPAVGFAQLGRRFFSTGAAGQPRQGLGPGLGHRAARGGAARRAAGVRGGAAGAEGELDPAHFTLTSHTSSSPHHRWRCWRHEQTDPCSSSWPSWPSFPSCCAFVLAQIGDLVHERQARKREAEQSVEQSQAGPQTLLGPLLTRNCKETWSPSKDTVQNRSFTVVLPAIAVGGRRAHYPGPAQPGHLQDQQLCQQAINRGALG